MYVPNVFSPNGVGPEVDETINPFFNSLSGIYEAWFRVYDRWGELLFEGHEVAPIDEELTGEEASLKWDGNFNGLPMDEGVYVWVLDFQTCSVPPAGCMGCNIEDWILEVNSASNSLNVDFDINNGELNCSNCSNPFHFGNVTLVR